MPSRPHIDKDLMALYNKCAQVIEQKITQCSSVPITTDGWTSRVTQSYITVTCHFVSSDWVIQNYTLQTRAMEESHTGVNVGNSLKECLLEWNIKKKTQRGRHR